MADNMLPGTQEPVGTKELLGVHYQRMQMGFVAGGAYGDLAIDNGLPVVAGVRELTGGPVSAANTDIIASTDARGYRSLVLQLTGTLSGSVTVQGSNNNSTWFTLPMYRLNSSLMIAPADTPSSPVPNLWLINLPTRYLRVRTSAFTSGAVSAVAELYSVPIPLPSQHGVTAYSENVGSGGLSAVQNAQLNTDADTFSGVTTALLVTNAGKVYSGSGWSPQRTASAAHGTTGTGLTGAGVLGFDGTNFRRLICDANGYLLTRPGAAAGSTVTPVASAITNTTLAAANTSRRGLSICNDSSAYLYIKEGATAAISGPASFTYKCPPGGLYELPQPVWQGTVDGIWSSVNGNALVTERT